MTFGLGGLFDVASTENFGNMPNTHEDFGQTLAVWGVPDGPYVMLPIFGPSSVRDSVEWVLMLSQIHFPSHIG